MPDYIRDSNQPSADKNRAYVYPHEYPNHWYDQTYLPEDVKDRTYYKYADNKTERAAKEYWEKVKKRALSSENDWNRRILSNQAAKTRNMSNKSVRILKKILDRIGKIR